MTCRTKDSNNIGDIVEMLNEEGLEGLDKVVSTLVNHAMEVERSKYLQAQPYERTETRVDYANGFKPKRLKSRLGMLDLAIPQVRGSNFYPSTLERGVRSERALRLAMAEMYVQGVATRKVKKITEELCGLELSSSDVSRAAKLLDEELEAWRTKPLGAYEYVYLDARYEKVRRDHGVCDSAVLVAYGVDPQGKRRILGVSVALSEQEVHWRNFLTSLVERGLHGVKLVISDAHAGLKAAKRAVLPSMPWQRCQFHLQQNAASHVPKRSMKKEVAAEIRSILNAPDETEAKWQLDRVVKKYAQSAPELSNWLEHNVPESLTVMSYPAHHRRRLGTSNLAERVNRELKRRTRTVGIFPNVASCLRLVAAQLAEIDDQWQMGRTYLSQEDNE